MSNKTENPPAFPMCDTEFKTVQIGMTLRDYFAAKALQGILSKHTLNSPEDQKTITQLSYELADEMLIHRSN